MHESPSTRRSAPSRRSLLTATAVAGGIAATAAGTGSATAATGNGSALAGAGSPLGPTAGSPFPRTEGFATTRRGEFEIGGIPRRSAGTNCYYLHYGSHYMTDSVLNNIAQMGLRVVRAWAFIDGPSTDRPSLHPQPYVYDEAAFEALDYSVWKAGTLGLRLVLALTNNWPDFGGMDQYVTWFGAAGHDEFYTDPKIRACYMAWAEHVITRRNRYTGVAYNADPTIMTWELANEPRCRSDRSGDTLVEWADTMSRHISALAPRQLVAVGDEGWYGDPTAADYPYSDYEGVDWKRLIALPAVDYGTVHLYPVAWGETKDPMGWGHTWITDHIRDARRIGKPVVIEEFGLPDQTQSNGYPEATILATYRNWTRAVETAGGAGDQAWLVTALVDDGTPYGDYDGFRITYPSPVAALLTAHAKRQAAWGAAATPPPVLTRSGTTLLVSGKRQRLSGMNAYWVGLDDNVRDDTGAPVLPARETLTTAFAGMRHMGANLVRTHTVGISAGTPRSFQTGPGTFSDGNLDSADWAVHEAGKQGILLMVPVTDQWNYYHGGKGVFVHWAYQQDPAGLLDVPAPEHLFDGNGAEKGSKVEDQFFANSAPGLRIRSLFTDYLTRWLNHVNPYTGLSYADDPTIAVIETGNEIYPATAEWTTAISREIRRLAPDKLIADGSAATGLAVSSAPGRDVATVDILGAHYYAQDSQYQPAPIMTLAGQLDRDVAAAAAAGKVFVMGEYPWTRSDVTRWYSKVEQTPAIGGDMVWSFIGGREQHGGAFGSDDYPVHWPYLGALEQEHAPVLARHISTVSGVALTGGAGASAPEPSGRRPARPAATVGRP